jgi:hypothetical protein
MSEQVLLHMDQGDLSVSTVGEQRIWRQESNAFMRRSAAIALALLLHLSVLIWLTLPALPWIQTVRTTTAGQSLLIHFINVPPLKRASTPLVTPHSTRAEILNRVTRNSRKPAVPAKQPVSSNAPPSPTESPTPSTDTQEPLATPYNTYGNSSLERALNSSQGGRAFRLPGDDEPARVPGIHVETPPSPAQRVSSIGHVLNCKDAIFKGRMTDQELAKRGLTEQQMLLKFTELGCH